MGSSVELFPGVVSIEPPKPEVKTYSMADRALQRRPIHWIIEGLLATSDLFIMAGNAKGKKSLLALYLAKCVATGQPFFGHPTRKMPVLYCAFEDKPETIDRRAYAMGFHALEGMDRDSLHVSFGIEALAAAEQWLKNGPCLVIYDPMIEMTSTEGASELDQAHMASFMRKYRDAAAQKEGAIVIIHHFSKANERMRGASAIEGGSTGWCNVLAVQDKEDTAKLIWKGREIEGKVFTIRVEFIGGADYNEIKFHMVAEDDTKEVKEEHLADRIRTVLASAGQGETVKGLQDKINVDESGVTLDFSECRKRTWKGQRWIGPKMIEEMLQRMGDQVEAFKDGVWRLTVKGEQIKSARDAFKARISAANDELFVRNRADD